MTPSYILKPQFLHNRFLFIILSLALFSCNNNEMEDYIQRDANKQDLIGTWAIYNVEVNGNKSEVPINFSECGRDFFSYNANETYEETIFNSSNCNAEKNIANWQLGDGVINLYSNNGESQVLEIRKLNKNILIFQANLDLDENEGEDAYIFTALKYNPPKENDIYTNTFYQKSSEKIEFSWSKYEGYNEFVKYEIYRTDDKCNLVSAKLIKTITNVNENLFVDLDAFSSEHCYQLKIYTDKGLLGESDLRSITTYDIRPKHVNIINGNTDNETVSISWEKSTDPYFSHYEIRTYDAVDFIPNHYHKVTTVDNINTTSFTDTNPPYLLKPIYVIITHNKFENHSYIKSNENTIAINLMRPGTLDMEYLTNITFDAEDHSFIFYYKESTYGNFKFAKYNYLEKKFVAESFKQPNGSTSSRMQIINSKTSYGKEFIYPQHDGLWVYNASDLTYKYNLQLKDKGLLDSFSYLSNDIWVITDDKNVFTYKRNEDAFTLLDKKPHFTDSSGGYNFEILKIDTDKILVSNDKEGRAILFTIDENGFIANKGIKNIPLQYGSFTDNVDYNINSSYVLNTVNNRIYNAKDYSLVQAFTKPAISSSLSKNGIKVYGTNNLQDLTDDYLTAKREVLILNIATGTIESKASQGYPLYVVEDNDGNIVSLSAVFPGENFRNYQSRVKNFFIEIIK